MRLHTSTQDSLVTTTVSCACGHSVVDVTRVPSSGGIDKLLACPLGHLLGTVKVVDCVPIIDYSSTSLGDVPLHPCVDVQGRSPIRWYHHDGGFQDVTSQLPYGDFTPGRWAWIFEVAKRTDEMCPWCLGSGCPNEVHNPLTCKWCPTCNGKGTCDPIPVKGRQKIWPWSP